MNILIACAEDRKRSELVGAFDRKGFHAVAISNGEEALHMLAVYSFDAVVLAAFPDRSAVDFARKARDEQLAVPILIISDRANDVDYVVAALNAGADDVMSLDVRHEVLCARLYSFIRRVNGLPSNTIKLDNLMIDITRSTVSVDGMPLNLTKREYAVLEMLALRQGRPVLKEAIFDAIYCGHNEPGIKIIDVFICKLRKKLMDALDGRDVITTVWGRGYMLVTKLDEVGQRDAA